MKQVPFLLKLMMGLSLVAAIGSSIIWFDRQHKLSKMSEQLEAEGHPWFVGCQFHPEFKSRPMRAHPLFREFIRAAKEFKAAK